MRNRTGKEMIKLYSKLESNIFSGIVIHRGFQKIKEVDYALLKKDKTFMEFYKKGLISTTKPNNSQQKEKKEGAPSASKTQAKAQAQPKNNSQQKEKKED